MKQFIKFGIIGSIGFIVDASILLFLVELLELNIPFSRFISFLFAVFVTWFLNKNFTFSKNEKIKKKKEYTLYLLIQSIGASLNYLIFILLINVSELFKENLLLPLAIASVIAMFFNFFTLKKKLYNSFS